MTQEAGLEGSSSTSKNTSNKRFTQLSDLALVTCFVRDLSPYLLRNAKEVKMESDRKILVGWIDKWIRHAPPRNPIPDPRPSNLTILSEYWASTCRVRSNPGIPKLGNYEK